jgi:hypothetical protein
VVVGRLAADPEDCRDGGHRHAVGAEDDHGAGPEREELSGSPEGTGTDSVAVSSARLPLAGISRDRRIAGYGRRAA